MILVLLATAIALPQTLVQRTFLVRAETTTIDPYSGMTHICVLVYPDGKYRLERSSQTEAGRSAEVLVYLDQLPDASLKQLDSVLDDPAFGNIHTPEPHGGMIQDLDVLMLSVPRVNAIQNLSFETAAQRKPFEKALKPFINWMKDVEKRKVRVAKGESSDNCRAPMVMYRSQAPLPSRDQNGPDQR
ncbi:MAG: hypothetical protein LAN36_00555 [Acidobacteriia bacterium]|nr:hypothetical protein [Terriglobia bacterium]